MDPIFRKTTITSVEAALCELRHVEFPEETYVTAAEVIALKRDARRNCDVLLALVYFLLPAAEVEPGHMAILTQLRRDVHLVRQECGRVKSTFLRPKHRRCISSLQKAYEEMTLAATCMCQQTEPERMDSLAAAL